MPIISPLITNNYLYELRCWEYAPDCHFKASGRVLKTIKRGGENEAANCDKKPASHVLISVPGMGDIAFINLGETVLPGYDFLPGQYGVLIRYQRREVYARYDIVGAAGGEPPEVWSPQCIVTRLGTLHIEDLFYNNPLPVEEGPKPADALNVQLSNLTIL